MLNPPRAGTGAGGSAVAPLKGVREEWPRLWPGWRLEFWADHYETQVERCGGAVAIPAPDVEFGRQQLARRVTDTWEFFLTEEVGANYVARHAGDAAAIAADRTTDWRRAFERTAATRAELARALQTVTGPVPTAR
jgi:hypothetical protein